MGRCNSVRAEEKRHKGEKEEKEKSIGICPDRSHFSSVLVLNTAACH